MYKHIATFICLYLYIRQVHWPHLLYILIHLTVKLFYKRVMSGNLQLLGSSFKFVWNSLKAKWTLWLKRYAYTNYRQFMSRFLQFTLRLGSKSVLSTCRAPDQPGEGVLLHYSYDNGITWKLLEHYSYLNYHEPRYVGNHLEKKWLEWYLLSWEIIIWME